MGMILYSLVGNVSGLSFLEVCFVTVVTFVSWIIVLLAGNIKTPDRDEGIYYPMIYVLLTGLLNLSSAYMQETYQRRKFMLMLRLKLEINKTDDFLYRMLPETVVAQMKQDIQVADEFDNIFILASDICGFTKMAAASEPSDVVRILSKLFSSFDLLSEQMGVYKVLTIGDAYIAVTGMINQSNEDTEEESNAAVASIPLMRKLQIHATALINFAKAMLIEIAKVEVPNDRCAPLNMRIGIHVGRVVAGVIGTKKLRYDIWGSDVITATAMESNGIPGEVCVSESVLKYLNGADFNFREHAKVELKTKNRDGSTQHMVSHQLLRD